MSQGIHRAGLVVVIMALGACTTTTPKIDTASVFAVGQTAPVQTSNDAADDPAIWRNPADPAKSLIVASDKKAGLYVYGLDGAQRQFLPAPRLNNVDLRGEVSIAAVNEVLVAASDRSDPAQAVLALFALSPGSGVLRPLGKLPAGDGEAYGICLYRRAADQALFAFLVHKSGRIVQLALDLAAAQPRATIVRELKLASQSEGCVADDRNGRLYVAEEDVGIWRFDADPASSAQAASFARADGRMLVADVEGLALAPGAGRDDGYLIASSQGDSAYAVYQLADGSAVGRFRISDNGAGIGGTSETDGIELALGDFGQDFPGGLFIAQDGDNAPQAQNFKLVSWAEVLRRLKPGS